MRGVAMNLKRIRFGSMDKFRVVVEIPKGSGVKYEYDDDMRAFVAKFFWQNGFTLPYNYGFAVETAAEDGDNLDVIVLYEKPLEMGAIVECAAISVLKLLDRGVPDHKIIAIPVRNAPPSALTEAGGLNQDGRVVIVDTLKEMARQKNKTIIIEGFFDKTEAEAILKKAHEEFEARW